MTTDKRVRLSPAPQGNLKKPVRASKIFSPFRTIGFVSDGTPFAVGTLGQTFYIATVVGRSFQIYDAATLHLLFVSSVQTGQTITSITAHHHFVYCSYGSKIGIFRRGRLEKELSLPSTDADSTILKLCTFGNYLIAATASKLHIFEQSGAEKRYPTAYYTSVPINFESFGNIVDLVHMPTYVNKVVVATTKNLLVVNIRTAKVVYHTDKLDDESAITCVQPSPALDILAFGTDGGNIGVFNIKKGKTLQEVSTGSHTPVTSISFRTDGTPHVVVSLRSGDLFFYDLERQARVHILRGAHKEAFGGCTKALFLNGQPIVVSTGSDNTLKEFVFDPVLSTTNTSVVAPPRHLRSRGGHAAPPSSILFADKMSHFIDSASNDRSLWMFSLRKDAQSQEMSQRQSKVRNGKRVAGLSSQYKDKFPPIIMMAEENAREGDWDNMVTAHQDETFARTWNTRNKRVGSHELATIDGGIVKCVAMTQCGNFALVGSSKGGIGVYNIQSGQLRKLYRLHKKGCTGVAVDAMNRKMVSAGLDGVVGFYDFSESKYLGKLQLEAPVTQIVFHRGSNLIALALDDLSIVIVDAITQRVVRQLFGHSNRITAMDFTPDGRWLVSASLDATIRTWDLPTGGCIDGIKVGDVATCLKISPHGDYMATAHVSSVGISLWTNKSQFHPVSTKSIESEAEFADVTLPNVSGDGGSSMLDGAFAKPEIESIDGQYISPDQLESSLVTLSHCSRNKFNTLLHLDTIRERNKPTEAPKKPTSAPFFMDLQGSAVGDRAKEAEEGTLDETADSEENGDDTRLLGLKDTDQKFESDFTRLLRECAQSNEDYTLFINYLVDMSPATTDLEVRSLSTTAPYTELIWFLHALTFGFQQNKNFELLTAVQSMFMRLHGDILYQVQHEEEDEDNADSVIEALNELNLTDTASNDKLDDLVKYCSCVVNFVSSA